MKKQHETLQRNRVKKCKFDVLCEFGGAVVWVDSDLDMGVYGGKGPVLPTLEIVDEGYRNCKV